MIANILQQMNLEYLGAISTVLFFAVFVAITIAVLGCRNRDEIVRQAALPLDDGNQISSKE